MSWLEAGGGAAGTVIGECVECSPVRGAQDLYVCLADTVEPAGVQRRLVDHFAAVLPVGGPGLP